jgi:branched-chain amino acid transport system permease protein
MSEWRMALYGVLLVILMIKRPNGLYGGKEFKFLQIKNNKRMLETEQH